MEVCYFYKVFHFLAGNLHFPSFNSQRFKFYLGVQIWVFSIQSEVFLCHLNLGNFLLFFNYFLPILVSDFVLCNSWYTLLDQIPYFKYSYIFCLFFCIWEFTLTWFSRLIISTLFYHLVRLFDFFNLTVLFLVARYFFFLSCSIFLPP